MGEKRKYVRFDVLMDAICRIGSSFKKLKVNNFSKEGIGILSRELFSKGEDLKIEMMIPGDDVPVLFEGEIVWMNELASDSADCQGGIKFKKISSGERGRILEYIYRNWIKAPKAEVK
ncbi:MAG: hypothetical protein DRP85_04615 [Candidatus Makaraimicrobium thalassicum]|nr:MAG: hypothetical protein DRP85_04615 [Candidatus Omnitrophota bacterium]